MLGNVDAVLSRRNLNQLDDVHVEQLNNEIMRWCMKIQQQTLQYRNFK